MCPDSNAAALRDMEAIFADSAGVRPATHSGTRYWLGLALVRDGQEERGLAMMEQAHCEFAYMDWDEMEAFAAKDFWESMLHAIWVRGCWSFIPDMPLCKIR